MLERGFERARQLRENRNPVRQFAIAQARGILQADGVVDPKLKGGLQQMNANNTYWENELLCGFPPSRLDADPYWGNVLLCGNGNPRTKPPELKDSA